MPHRLDFIGQRIRRIVRVVPFAAEQAVAQRAAHEPEFVTAFGKGGDEGFARCGRASV